MKSNLVTFYDFTWANEREDQDAYAVSKGGTVMLLSEAADDASDVKVACTECQAWTAVTDGPTPTADLWDCERTLVWTTVDAIPEGALVHTDGGWHYHKTAALTLARVGYK